MTTSQTDTHVTAASRAPNHDPDSAGKPRSRKTQATPTVPKSARKSRQRTKTSKSKPAKTAPGARKGSKTAKLLALLKRPNGVTLTELLKATGWQPHSVRGFLSGTVGKKMGLKVSSTKDAGGNRRYSLKA